MNLQAKNRIHLIAIGGAVMHNLAICLKQLGHEVSGSDDEIFEPSKSRLAANDLLPQKMGWDENAVNLDLDFIILGMHSKASNPELIKALQIGLKVYSFPEFIYEQAKDKFRVVVAGSHGKTTTTAMIMHVLKTANKSFDYLVGSQLEGFDTMVQISDAPLIVIEGDEYLNSAIDPRPKFHFYKPHAAVITGIAWDHINVFPTLEEYNKQFSIFLETLPDGAPVAYFESDEVVKAMLQNQTHLKPLPYFGLDAELVEDVNRVNFQGKSYPFSVFGKHNMQNAEAAMLMCAEMGITNEDFLNAMRTFSGTSRRLEQIFSNGNSYVFRDFAHSPSKVKATVDAVSERFADKKIIAVLELHTYSSLNAEFLKEYHNTLSSAQEAIVYYNPKVLQHKNLPDLDEEFVNKCFGEITGVITNTNLLGDYLKSTPLDNCVVLLMSSGNFDNLKFNFT